MLKTLIKIPTFTFVDFKDNLNEVVTHQIMVVIPATGTAERTFKALIDKLHGCRSSKRPSSSNNKRTLINSLYAWKKISYWLY